MPLKKFLIITLTITILSSIFYLLSIFKAQKLDKIEVNIKDKNYKLEIADTVSSRAKGLSRRKHLCSNCGMLFVFNRPAYQIFWMKDTLIPLDIIFLDKDKKITAIHQAQPQPHTPILKLKRYGSQQPSLFVIELKAGQSQKIGLQIGQTINFDYE